MGRVYWGARAIRHGRTREIGQKRIRANAYFPRPSTDWLAADAAGFRAFSSPPVHKTGHPARTIASTAEAPERIAPKIATAARVAGAGPRRTSAATRIANA